MLHHVASFSIYMYLKDVSLQQVNDQKHFDPEQQRVCFANYFEDLTVPKDKNYDSVFLGLCNVRSRSDIHIF